MKTITTLIERINLSQNSKLLAAYQHIATLLNTLALKELPLETIDFINTEIGELNSIDSADKNFFNAIKAKEKSIVNWIEKKHQIVPKNYYRKQWMILGMAGIGIPLGLALGLFIGNLGIMGVGLPIGMGLGLAIGSLMDKKALEEGRQIDFEVK